MDKKPATTEAMGELHEELARLLKEKLEKMHGAKEENASFLNVVRQFLKDNGIQALPGNKRGALSELERELEEIENPKEEEDLPFTDGNVTPFPIPNR